MELVKKSGWLDTLAIWPGRGTRGSSVEGCTTVPERTGSA